MESKLLADTKDNYIYLVPHKDNRFEILAKSKEYRSATSIGRLSLKELQELHDTLGVLLSESK